jgi:hypothetical protein
MPRALARWMQFPARTPHGIKIPDFLSGISDPRAEARGYSCAALGILNCHVL